MTRSARRESEGAEKHARGNCRSSAIPRTSAKANENRTRWREDLSGEASFAELRFPPRLPDVKAVASYRNPK